MPGFKFFYELIDRAFRGEFDYLPITGGYWQLFTIPRAWTKRLCIMICSRKLALHKQNKYQLQNRICIHTHT